MGGHKDEKNSYLSTTYTTLAEIWLCDIWSIHVLILQISLKSVERSTNFEKYTFEKIGEFLTKFYSILGLPTVFLRSAAEINNKNTLKIMQENYENHWSEFKFFSWLWDESEDKILIRTFKIIDLNRFLSIEISYYR